ncbi:MAG TPA: hypothetical protein VFN43_09065 [Humibacillus sp.]|nr:hypothetical protein [Humibacillus sp.]
MSTPPDAVTRSTVVAPSDPGRMALAMVLHRLAMRHWVDLLVPATLVFALEWLLGLPVVVGLLLAVATAAVLVTVRIWQARRRIATTFPVGDRLTVTAGPAGLVVTRGEGPPAFDARWHLFDRATLVRDHLVIGMRGSQLLIVLPAAVSDAGLVHAVEAGVAGEPIGDVSTLPATMPESVPPGASHVDGVASADGVALTDAETADPARVTRAVLDEATIARMSRDFTVESITGLRTLALLGLLVGLSVLVQFSASATTRWMLPALTVLFIGAVVIGGYLGTRRVLRRSPGGHLTLTFGDDGFTAVSEVGTARTRYRDIVGVKVRGETVMLRGTGGAVALYPRSLFPEPVLAELRAAASPR